MHRLHQTIWETLALFGLILTALGPQHSAAAPAAQMAPTPNARLGAVEALRRPAVPNETFQLQLGYPDGAAIGHDQATGTIVNDDSSNTGEWLVNIPVAIAVPAPPRAPDDWATIAAADFEGGFPAGWASSDDNGATGGRFTWGRRDCRAFAGRFGGWAVGGGTDGAGLGCGSSYPNNALARTTYGPFSLAGVTAAQLRFKLWLLSELNFDGLCALASVNGRDFYGSCASGNSNGWVDLTLDLSNVYRLGNLTGQSRVWVAFAFVSDASVNRPEGAYIDDVLLRKCPGACGSTAQAPAQITPEVGFTTQPAELHDGAAPVLPQRQATKGG